CPPRRGRRPDAGCPARACSSRNRSLCVIPAGAFVRRWSRQPLGPPTFHRSGAAMKTRVLPMFLALLAPAAQAGSSAAADGVLDLTFAVGGDRTVAFDRGGNLTDVGRAVVVD